MATTDEDHADVVLQEITVSRRLKPDGSETYKIEYAAGINFVSDLGLLEAAKHDLYERMRLGDDYDEADEDGT